MEIDWEIALDRQVFFSIVINIILLIFGLFLLAIVYRGNMETISGQSYSALAIISIFFRANIAKYLPGNVFHFAGRNLLGLKRNIDQKVLLASTAMLHLQSITLALVIPAISDFEIFKEIFTFIAQLVNKNYLLLISGLLVLMVLLTIIFFDRLKVFFQKVRKNLNKKTIGKLLINSLVFAFYLITYGLTFYLMAYSITGGTTVGTELILKFVNSFILAWLCGLVIVGVPGGIGIREAVLLFLLQGFLNNTDLFLIIIFHRLCTIAADLFAFIIGNYLESTWERKYEEETN